MNKIILSPQNIHKVFKDLLKDSNNYFVFSTDVVKNSWIDWIITHQNESGVDAVSLEHFFAWDIFKEKFVNSKKEGFSVIPSILKKMFVHNLIYENSQKPINQRFQKIIKPEDTFSNEAESFTDWIYKILPSLHFWKKRLTENEQKYGNLDDEDKDFLFIYESYKKFLDENTLFEPSWVDILWNEKNVQQKHFYIFFPEILEDFCDYEEVLEKSDFVTIFSMDFSNEKPKSYFYPDSRSELRQTILQIIDLVQTGKTDFSRIALSVPQLEIYRPYLEREFSLYNVPFVIRSSEPYTKNCAGRIFREIYDCITSDFSYDSLRTLLLDECVPWKEEIRILSQNLIFEANNMRCICSIKKSKDIFYTAFTNKINSLNFYKQKIFEQNDLELENKNKKINKIEKQIKYFDELKSFYLKITFTLKKFISEKEDLNTFSNILKAWMEFKQIFLCDENEFSQEANNFLSRCIVFLREIIQISKDYEKCNLKITSPFSFFLNELEKKSYKKVDNNFGVNIYPYQVSALGYFDYQFVIDCSQKNLDVNFKRLPFINSTKREKLGLINDENKFNVTKSLIYLYAKQNNDFTPIITFSSAENTFSGFAIPNSNLDIQKDLPNFDENDFILNEQKIIKNGVKNNDFLEIPKQVRNDNEQVRNESEIYLTENQKKSFLQWKNNFSNNHDESKNYFVNDIIKNKINKKLRQNNKTDNSFYTISARGDFENFFPCQRKWLLKKIIHLKEESLSIQLMKSYDMGNVNHKVLELIMNEFLKKRLPYFFENRFFIIKDEQNMINPLPIDFTDEFLKIIEEKTILALKSNLEFSDCPLTILSLKSQSKSIAQNITNFLQFLLIKYKNVLDKSGNSKSINGIGNCIVLGSELEEFKSFENYNFTGKIDLLLETPEKSIVIIDFKNSKSSFPKQKECKINDDKIIQDFQMPVYYKLITENYENKIEAGYFYSIRTLEKQCMTDESAKSTFEDFLPTINELETYSKSFIERIDNYDFVPKTSKDKTDKLNVKYYENCINCNYKSICRTTYTVGKNILLNK